MRLFHGGDLVTYVEFPSDAAFTLFLALLKPGKVSGESHVRLNTSEKRMVAYSRRQMSSNDKRLAKNKKTSAPGSQSVRDTRQLFTNKQIEIAMAVLAEQENHQKES